MSPRTQDALSRKPGGKGRFDPSEPLHMTTRHAAARNGRPRGSSSINGSVDDDESRRSSLDDVQQPTAHNLSSPNGRRISGESDRSANYRNQSSASIAAANRMSKTVSSLLTSPSQHLDVQMPQSPSRKRKRTYSPPLITQSLDTNTNPAILLSTTKEDVDTFDEVIVMVPEDHLSDRVSAGSSSGQDAEHYMAATQSTEVTPAGTPMASEPVSPVSDETNPTPRYSRKHVDVVMADLDVPGGEEELDDIDQDEAPAVAEDVDDGADLEDDEDPATAGPRKRLTGRRRVDHHETEVEAAMRRQLQLKSAYRSIARALKPVLAEIASKTVEELESDLMKHQQVIEYEKERGIQQLLDAALADRKRKLELQVKHTREQLKGRFVGERAALISLCQNQVQMRRETAEDQVLLDILHRRREIRREQGRYEDATDDEDGNVLLRPKHTDHRAIRGPPIEPEYESRSRLGLDLERTLQHMERRFDMSQVIEEMEEIARIDERFTVLDTTARDAAQAQRESVHNVSTLVDAAAEVDRRAAEAERRAAEAERLARMPVIPNEQAFKLQILGDIASSNDPRTAAPLPALSRQLGEPFAFEKPQMRPPTASQRAPPEFGMHHQSTPQMSPGTEQFLKDSLPSMPSPHRHSRQGSHSERPSSFCSTVAPSPSPSRKGLADFPHLRQLFGDPIMSPPNRPQSPPRQRPGQISHNAPRHYGQPFHAANYHVRHPSHDSIRAMHSSHQGVDASTPGAQSSDDGPRDGYHRPPTRASGSRSALQDERAAYDPARDSRSRSGRHTEPAEDNFGPRAEPRTRHPLPMDDTNHEPPSNDVYARPQRQIERPEPAEIKPHSPILAVQRSLQDASLEQPSKEGATETLPRESELESTRQTEETNEEIQPTNTHSLASSPNPSTTTDVSGSQDGDRGLSGQKDRKRHMKLNKAQRHGLSRKTLREQNKAQQKLPHGEQASRMGRFRLDKDSNKSGAFTSRMPTGTPQSAHRGPDLPYPALPSYNQHAPQPPFPPAYGPHPPHFDHPDSRHPHRNSLPGGGGPIPWPQPYGPGYGHPHGPAAMGPPPESWREGPPGAMPPHALGPPPGLSRTSSSNSQYGGPTIAPARPDSRYPFGPGPSGGNHPPAFAQQQRHSEGNGGRRRTHSEAHGKTKWLPYEPKGSRR